MKEYFSEIKFWEDTLKSKDLIEENIKTAPVHLLPYLRNRVLDVGSGPVSRLHSFTNIHLVCTDILADFYEYFKNKYNVKTDYEIMKSQGESLSLFFESFDTVYCSNALDHTQNPDIVFDEMVKILKVGGYLIIETWLKEATAMGFYGLHQHDLFMTQDKCLACDTRGDVKILSNRPDLKLVLSPGKVEERIFFTMVWEKIQ